MSEEWAAIVYGRSYHLDFRFITIPHDFDTKDTAWALQYILATTQQARNLANSPRWSMFKNGSYCIVGVTCMVRDLIETMVKDDRGRPLYVFVGYVARSAPGRSLSSFPEYEGECLDSFKILYQEIEKVWSIKEYERDRRSPWLSQYQPLDRTIEIPPTDLGDRPPKLNDRSKHPNMTYLWSSVHLQNKLLWQASARCSQPTSTCLNINGKPLVNSPFLNQTVAQLDGFQIKERVKTSTQEETSIPDSSDVTTPPSLSQKISLRAREDLDLTLQQAAKVATASQELIGSFGDWSKSKETPADDPPDLQTNENNENNEDADSFGFKTKKPSSTTDEKDTTNKQDWF